MKQTTRLFAALMIIATMLAGNIPIHAENAENEQPPAEAAAEFFEEYAEPPAPEPAEIHIPPPVAAPEPEPPPGPAEVPDAAPAEEPAAVPEVAADKEADAESAEIPAEEPEAEAVPEKTETAQPEERIHFQARVEIRIEKKELYYDDDLKVDAVITEANLGYELKWEKLNPLLPEKDQKWEAFSRENPLKLKITEAAAALNYRLTVTATNGEVITKTFTIPKPSRRIREETDGAEEAEPENPTETAEEAEPQEPAETAEEAEPQEPAETAEEAEPENPTEAAEEAEPEGPTKTAEEADPERPAGDAEKAEPQEPTETAEEADPERLAGDAEEAEPQEPTETAEEAEPQEPTETAEEAEPEGLTETAEEADPERPVGDAEEAEPEKPPKTAEETEPEGLTETAEEADPERPPKTAEETEPKESAETAEEAGLEAPGDAEEAEPEKPPKTAEETEPKESAETAEEASLEAPGDAEEAESEEPPENAEEADLEEPPETADEAESEKPAGDAEEAEPEKPPETAEEAEPEEPPETAERTDLPAEPEEEPETESNPEQDNTAEEVPQEAAFLFSAVYTDTDYGSFTIESSEGNVFHADAACHVAPAEIGKDQMETFLAEQFGRETAETYHTLNTFILSIDSADNKWESSKLLVEIDIKTPSAVEETEKVLLLRTENGQLQLVDSLSTTIEENQLKSIQFRTSGLSTYAVVITQTDPMEEPLESEEMPAEPEVSGVRVFTSFTGVIQYGEPVNLTSEVDGDVLNYQWECDRGQGFEKVEGANGPAYSFTATPESLCWDWRLTVTRP